MRSKELSQQLTGVEIKTDYLFEQIVRDEYDFVKEVTEDKSLTHIEALQELIGNNELYLLPTIEFRDYLTGNTFDGHVCKVRGLSIYIVKMDDEIKVIKKFTNCASLEDKLVLLNEMENLVV